MRAKFEDAIGTILKHEGGYVDHPNDPGGATNYGISLRFLHQTKEYDLGDMDNDGDLDVDDIKKMTVDRACQIYKKHWWDKYHYSELFADQKLATKVFDLAVNMGGRQAHKLLQRAMRASGLPLEDDGIIGPKTKHALVEAELKGLESQIVSALRSEAAGFYKLLICQNPKFKSFERGWLKRAYS